VIQQGNAYWRIGHLSAIVAIVSAAVVAVPAGGAALRANRAHPLDSYAFVGSSLSVRFGPQDARRRGSARTMPQAGARPKLGISPTFIKAGTSATVRGSGLPVNIKVEVGFVEANCRCDASPKGTAKTDASGRFRWRYMIPPKTRPGAYVFWAWAERLGRTIHAAVTVTTPPLVGTTRVYLPNCGTTWYMSYRPRSWSSGCTGGALNLSKLRWREYGRRRAQAIGEAGLREPCGAEPCFKAGIYKAQAKLSASRPLRCSAGTLAGAWYFSRVQAEVLYRNGNPFGARPGWKSSIFTIKAHGGICHHTPP